MIGTSSHTVEYFLSLSIPVMCLGLGLPTPPPFVQFNFPFSVPFKAMTDNITTFFSFTSFLSLLRFAAFKLYRNGRENRVG
jgi:hypothetical protein